MRPIVLSLLLACALLSSAVGPSDAFFSYFSSTPNKAKKTRDGAATTTAPPPPAEKDVNEQLREELFQHLKVIDATSEDEKVDFHKVNTALYSMRSILNVMQQQSGKLDGVLVRIRQEVERLRYICDPHGAACDKARCEIEKLKADESDLRVNVRAFVADCEGRQKTFCPVVWMRAKSACSDRRPQQQQLQQQQQQQLQLQRPL